MTQGRQKQKTGTMAMAKTQGRQIWPYWMINMTTSVTYARADVSLGTNPAAVGVSSVHGSPRDYWGGAGLSRGLGNDQGRQAGRKDERRARPPPLRSVSRAPTGVGT